MLNSALTDLSGLDSLTYVGGSVLIFGNSELLSVTSLSNLKTIQGDLQLSFNNKVTTFAALTGVSVGGECSMSNFGCNGACSCEDLGITP
jgi:hypothetical protein